MVNHPNLFLIGAAKDGSVNYSQFLQFGNVPENIMRLCGSSNLRFIYVLRHPVDRAISQYFWRRERYGEDRPVETAIAPGSQYMLSSQYDLQIQQYFKIFDPAQFNFVKFDSYYADVAGSYAPICRWLGLNDSYVPDTTRHRGATDKKRTRTARFPALNRIARSSATLRGVVKTVLPHRYQIRLTRALSREISRPEIPAEVRDRLTTLFRDSIAATQSLTGLDLSDWS